MNAEGEVARLPGNRAAALRAQELEGAVGDRSADIVMFDVPEPLRARGIDAYRDAWTLNFRDPGSRLFELRETHVVAGEDVAWVRAILRCTTSDLLEVRLTMGLRKIDRRCEVEHEHHSFPVKLDVPA